MAGKTKGGKKSKQTAAPVADAGCQGCNFSGEVCRECGEPQTGCECKVFAPVACGRCHPAEVAATPEPAAEQAAAAPSIADVEAAMDAGQPVDIKPDGSVEIGDAEQAGDAAQDGKPVGELIGDHHGQKTPEPTADSDPELSALLKENVNRRLQRIQAGTRRRHHTKQLSERVLRGIIRAGEAAAQGGADGFFGRWTRNDLMAWEGLMDAAEWAQEEINARAFRRMKRESVAASAAEKTQEATA